MRNMTAVGALVAGMLCIPAAAAQDATQDTAEQAEAEQPAAPGEIIVTARKRAESLQEVPSAITALGEEQLNDLQVSGFQDVGKTVPNLHVQKQAGSPTAPQFNLRGVSTGSLNFQTDSGIALYVDGVYIGRPGNSGSELADLERLEVARGPQGTLFGRNSVGGAISFFTAAPTGELGAIGELTIGNYDRTRVRTTLNTPEWNGFSARLTYVHDENRGYVENSAPIRTFTYGEPFGRKTSARSFGASNSEGIFAALRYRAANLLIDYKFDYSDLVTTIDGMQLLNAGPTFTAITDFPNQPALGGTNVVDRRRRSELPIDGIAPSTQETWGHSLTATLDFNSDVSLKYIGAVRGFTVNTASELDGNALADPAGSGLPYQLLTAILYAKQRQWSHELQLLGTSPSLDWVAGLFTFRETAHRDSVSIFGKTYFPGEVVPITNPDSYLGGGSLQEFVNVSHAAFGHLTYRVMPGVELSGGLRYSRDDRTEDDLVDLPRDPPRGAYTAKQDRLNYDLSVKVAAAEGVNVYGRYATGHVSGGIFNSVEFEPETVKSYEVGVKTELFDRRVRLDVALFDAKRENLQVSGFLFGVGNILTNAGSSRARGVEVEGSISPVEGLTLTGSYGFVDVTSTSRVRTQQPRHTGYVSAAYETPLAGTSMTLKLRGDAQYEGRQFRISCPIGSTASAITGCSDLENADYELDNALVIPSSWDLGARVTLADIPMGDRKASVSLWGRNLLNNDKLEYLFQVLPLHVLGTFQTPRTFGVDFRIDL